MPTTTTLEEMTGNMASVHWWAYLAIIGLGAIVALVSFTMLIPLDTVAAVTGVFTIVGVTYAICLILWVLTLKFFAGGTASNLTWLNTHILFLVVLPATIGATAMNVTSIQNTRNLMAGMIAPS